MPVWWHRDWLRRRKKCSPHLSLWTTWISKETTRWPNLHFYSWNAIHFWTGRYSCQIACHCSSCFCHLELEKLHHFLADHVVYQQTSSYQLAHSPVLRTGYCFVSESLRIVEASQEDPFQHTFSFFVEVGVLPVYILLELLYNLHKEIFYHILPFVVDTGYMLEFETSWPGRLTLVVDPLLARHALAFLYHPSKPYVIGMIGIFVWLSWWQRSHTYNRLKGYVQWTTIEWWSNHDQIFTLTNSSLMFIYHSKLVILIPSQSFQGCQRPRAWTVQIQSWATIWMKMTNGKEKRQISGKFWAALIFTDRSITYVQTGQPYLPTQCCQHSILLSLNKQNAE